MPVILVLGRLRQEYELSVQCGLHSKACLKDNKKQKQNQKNMNVQNEM